jgi:arylsulfatase
VRVDDFKYRFTDQPNGWFGPMEKVDWPILVNLRLDPYERTSMFNGKDNGSISYYDWFACGFSRFVFVQQVRGEGGADDDRLPADTEQSQFQYVPVKGAIVKAIAARAVGK